MNLDHLNGLPNWDDEHIKRLSNEEEDDWRPNPTSEACKAMYIKWSEIVMMLKGALGNETDQDEPGQHDAEFLYTQKAMILGDAFEVGAKIRSSEVGGMYVLRMENAAIIRKNAQSIKSGLLIFDEEDDVEDDYCKIIRDEIDNFRELFKAWVATFKKDAYTDDWGLFV